MKERSNVSYSRAKEIVLSQPNNKSLDSHSPQHLSSQSYSQALQSNTSLKQAFGQDQPPVEKAITSCRGTGDEHTLVHCLPEDHDTSAYPRNISISTENLLMFVTDVVKRISEVLLSGKTPDAVKIVSGASRKLLGYPIDLQILNDTTCHPDYQTNG